MNGHLGSLAAVAAPLRAPRARRRRRHAPCISGLQCRHRRRTNPSSARRHEKEIPMTSMQHGPAPARRSLDILLRATAASVALAALAPAQVRLVVPPGGTVRLPQTQDAPGLVTQDLGAGGLTPADLVAALVGAGVSVSNIQFNGAPVAGGTFSGGSGIVGFAQGVILSSGDIASVVGPQNLLPYTSTDNLRPGDPDLDLLVAGQTQDACVLEFDFQCPGTNVVSFQYVFASEEYDEYVDTTYNDVFAFFLNGQNIALIPGTTQPVSINNVNCGNPWAPGGGPNCPLYTTNDCDSMGLGYPCTALATEMDGITSVYSAVGTLMPGLNHIKLVVADRSDGVYDTNVFVRGQSFACAQPGPAFDPPTPCGQILHATVGSTLQFEIEALATNGLPGESVIVDASGDPAILSQATFTPPLPAGPADDVEVFVDWTPTQADLGLHTLWLTATDQLQQVSTCEIFFDVTGALSTWTDLGHSLPGSKGPPHLLGTGPLFAGSDNALEMSDANPLSVATLVLGLSQINAPFKGGVMVPFPMLLVTGLTTTGTGDLNLPFVWPDGVPIGTSVLFQYWISDHAAVHGLSASNGLEATAQ
jgi:hypothetical protein